MKKSLAIILTSLLFFMTACTSRKMPLTESVSPTKEAILTLSPSSKVSPSPSPTPSVMDSVTPSPEPIEYAPLFPSMEPLTGGQEILVGNLYLTIPSDATIPRNENGSIMFNFKETTSDEYVVVIANSHEYPSLPESTYKGEDDLSEKFFAMTTEDEEGVLILEKGLTSFTGMPCIYVSYLEMGEDAFFAYHLNYAVFHEGKSYMLFTVSSNQTDPSAALIQIIASARIA